MNLFARLYKRAMSRTTKATKYRNADVDKLVNAKVGGSTRDTLDAIDRLVCSTPGCRKCGPSVKSPSSVAHRRAPTVSADDVYSDGD